MNVKGIGADSISIATFLLIAIPLTFVTMWILLSFQMDPPGKSQWTRLFWPVSLLMRKGRGAANAEKSSV